MINNVETPVKVKIFNEEILTQILEGLKKAYDEEFTDLQKIFYLIDNDTRSGLKFNNAELVSIFDNDLVKKMIYKASLIVPIKEKIEECSFWKVYVWNNNELVVFIKKIEDDNIEIRKISFRSIKRVTLLIKKDTDKKELSFEAYGEKYKLSLQEVPVTLLSVSYKKTGADSKRYEAKEIDFKNTFNLLIEKFIELV